MKVRTHCKHGHEFTPENTKFQVSGAHRPPFRICLACRRDRDRDGPTGRPRSIADNMDPWQINGRSSTHMIGPLTDKQFNVLDILHAEGAMEIDRIVEHAFTESAEAGKRRMSTFVNKGIIAAVKYHLPQEPSRKVSYQPTELGRKAYEIALGVLEGVQ